jgi:putative salt-induced outer membrane protein YdiY
MNKTMIIAIAVSSILSMGVAVAEEEEDTEGFESQFVAGLTLTEGNSETLAINGGASTKKIDGDRQCMAGVDFNYGEQTSTTSGKTETTVENVTAFAQSKKNLREKTYGYFGADFLYDDIAAVDYRVTLGPGIGRSLMKDANATLDVEAGVVWVFEDVADVDDDYAALRVAQTYERDLSETARVWQLLEWIPEFEDSDNVLVNFEIGAEAAMTGNTSLRVVLRNRYDNTPGIVNGVELDENDLSLIAGVAIKL